MISLREKCLINTQGVARISRVEEYRSEFQVDTSKCENTRNSQNSEPRDLEHVPDRDKKLPNFQRTAP